MKVTIITVCYNFSSVIVESIESVISQKNVNIEHIIIDGGSNLESLSILEKYRKFAKIISEPDKGMYDALNKGILLATGDIIGILHADDHFYNDSVVSKIIYAFENNDIDAVIGDVIFISNKKDKTLRNYSSKSWKPNMFTYGIMPPHPSFFCRVEVFKKYGLYKVDYKIAADFEMLLRLLYIMKLRFKYLPIITTKMRIGGKSTKNFMSNIILNQEIKRACIENGIYTNYFMIYSKYFFKIKEFF